MYIYSVQLELCHTTRYQSYFDVSGANKMVPTIARRQAKNFLSLSQNWYMM